MKLASCNMDTNRNNMSTQQRNKLPWGKILLHGLLAMPLLWTMFLYSMGASWRAQYNLGLSNLWAIRQTHSVEAFRINPHNVSSTALGQYAIMGSSVDLTSSQVSRLKSALLQAANTDEISSEKDCAISPGVAFRLWHGNDGLDVPVCYECTILIVDRMGGRALDFDSSRPEFAKLAKEAFPNDKEIQNFNESK